MKAAAAKEAEIDSTVSDPESWDTSGDEGDDPAHNPNVKGVGHASSGRQPVPNEDDGEGEEDGSGDDGAGADAEDASLDIGDDDVDDSGADEELDDEFEEGTAAAEERRRSHSDASASDSEGEGEKGADGAAAGDNKAASFARAFAKIMATGGAQKGILSASKTLKKRKVEEVEAAKADREAKALKREMRRKGHVTIPKKGQDPQHDIKEKALARIGTRGVVRLFNAVAKAQKMQKAAAEGPKRQVAAISKASFLAELQGQAMKSQVSEQLVPVRATGLVPAAREPVEVAGTGSGWAVLQDDLVGVAGTGTKLKDWDKVLESEDDDDMAGEREGVSSSDEEPEW